MNKTFCSAKFKQASLHLQSGRVHMCHHPATHQISYDKVQSNPLLLFNTPELKQSRFEMLSDKRPQECSYCWEIEDSGGISDRITKSLELGVDTIIGTDRQNYSLQDFLPTYLEVSFSNVCNMKCAYCKESDSSLWMHENKVYGKMPGIKRRQNVYVIPHREYNPYLEAFQTIWPDLKQNLSMLRITGGEPLLDKHTWQYLQDLCDDPIHGLTIALNTNLMADTAIIQRLIRTINQLHNQQYQIEIYTSLDTMNVEQSEYIRFGMKCQTFLKHLDMLIEHVKEPLKITNICSVSNLSVLGLNVTREYFEYLNRNSQHEITMSTPHIRSPEIMGVNIGAVVTLPYLTEYLNRIPSAEVMLQRSAYNLIEYAKGYSSIPKRQFRQYWDEYDRRRGTNFLKVFPEFRDIYYAE